MLTGTIHTASDEADFLTSLGIEIVATKPLAKGVEYECRASETALSRLNPHWRRFRWSFTNTAFPLENKVVQRKIQLDNEK